MSGHPASGSPGRDIPRRYCRSYNRRQVNNIFLEHREYIRVGINYFERLTNRKVRNFVNVNNAKMSLPQNQPRKL
jgi:hypothetical protein